MPKSTHLTARVYHHYFNIEVVIKASAVHAFKERVEKTKDS
jgi:hypothetical protein